MGIVSWIEIREILTQRVRKIITECTERTSLPINVQGNNWKLVFLRETDWKLTYTSLHGEELPWEGSDTPCVPIESNSFNG